MPTRPPPSLNLGRLLSAADLLNWCFSSDGKRQLGRLGRQRAQYVIDETVRPIMELERGHPLVGRLLTRAFRGRWVAT